MYRNATDKFFLLFSQQGSANIVQRNIYSEEKDHYESSHPTITNLENLVRIIPLNSSVPRNSYIKLRDLFL